MQIYACEPQLISRRWDGGNFLVATRKLSGGGSPLFNTMKKIQLTRGKSTIIDDEDFDLISKYRWTAWKKSKPNLDGVFKYYATACINKKSTFLHRLLMGFPDCEVDHKDGDGLNNLRSNLRMATRSQNQVNRTCYKNRFGYKGIYFNKETVNKHWYGRIKFQGKNYYAGGFKTLEEAARGYDRLALQYHGEFAVLNFPDEEVK